MEAATYFLTIFNSIFWQLNLLSILQNDRSIYPQGEGACREMNGLGQTNHVYPINGTSMKKRGETFAPEH
jgi:hypothetical protein